jgi:mannose-1-phosphate guanylyltransferase
MNGIDSQATMRIAEFSENAVGMPQTLAALILAGGDGTRLTPLARTITGQNTPKQFCPLLGEDTLLEQTHKRVSLIVPSDRVATILTYDHQRFFQRIVDASKPNIVVQPRNRGTAPAILYGILRLIRLGFRGSIATFPSDHYVSDDDTFMRHVETAVESKRMHPERIVLLGVEATEPETQYGWIEPKETAGLLPLDADSVMPVRRFWEKPHPALARELWQRGFLWNTFVMVASVDGLLDLFARALPQLYVCFAQLLPTIGTDAEPSAVASAYNRIESSGFSDSILAEFVEHLYVLRVSGLEWNDLGESSRVLATIRKHNLQPGWVRVPVSYDTDLVSLFRRFRNALDSVSK